MKNEAEVKNNLLQLLILHGLNPCAHELYNEIGIEFETRMTLREKGYVQRDKNLDYTITKNGMKWLRKRD